MKQLIPLIILVLFTACTSSDNQENPIINHVQDLLPHKPDSAFIYLESHLHNFSTPEDKAVAELLEYYINDLRTFNYQKNSIATDILRNDHYYTDKYYQALGFYYKGVFLIEKLEYEKAIELFNKAEEIAKSMKWDHLLGMIYNKSAEIFYDLALYNTSIEYANKSSQYFISAGDSIFANRSKAYQIYSLAELLRYEDVEQMYQTTKDCARSEGDTDFIEYLDSELIGIYLFKGDIPHAKSVYDDIRTINTSNKHLLAELLFLSKKNIEVNQLDSAYYYLSLTDQNKELIHTYDQILLKSIYSSYYQKKGDYKSALSYLNERHNLLDSIANFSNKALLVKLEGYSRELKMQLSYDQKITAQKRIVFGIILAFAAVMIFIFIYRYRFKKQKLELNNRIALVSEIVSDLKHSNQTLLSKLDTHQEKENQLKEHIESRLAYAKMFADLYYKYPNKPGTILKKMNEMIDLVPTNKEFTSGIINNVNLYYNNAIEKLTQKHTGLANTEILFSSLIIAGFSPHEMSLILNCNSLDAVYTRKYRLKQKLNINKNTDVEDYLLRFVQE